MNDPQATMSISERLEFRFRWSEPEHRRFYRALQREVRRGSKARWLLNVWFFPLALVSLQGMVSARTGSRFAWAFAPLAFIGVAIFLDRWGLSYLSARSYARNHAPCIPNDQVRVLNGDGLAAQCTTSHASVHWNGIVKVRETPEFFLFFTTPKCAIQLPKRAVPDSKHLRVWLRHAAESRGMADVRMEP
jgi:hypothetical protein